MTKRKVLIVIGAVASALIVIILIATASLINMLPGPKALAGSLKEDESAKAQTQVAANQVADPASTSATTTSLKDAVAADADQAEVKSEKAAAEQKNEELFDKLLTEDPTDIRVCDNLGRTPHTAQEMTKEVDFNVMMSERDDAVNEAFRYPILQVFNDPTLKDFLSEVKEIKDRTASQTEQEKDSWLEKAGFYSRMAVTAAKVYTRKAEFEHMGNQAQHLSALAKLAALKPEFAVNGQLQTLCRSIQDKARVGQESDLINERRELVQIFRTAGVDPKTIDFDPAKWIHFTMKYDKKSFSFNLSDEEKPKP